MVQTYFNLLTFDDDDVTAILLTFLFNTGYGVVTRQESLQKFWYEYEDLNIIFF